MGKIRASASATVRFARKVKRAANGCLLWTGAVGSHGYGNFWDGERYVLAHKFAWEQQHGRTECGGRCGPVLLHNCPGGDNSLCCEVTHLRLGTHGENHADTIAKGRGPQYHRALSPQQLEQAMTRWRAGESQEAIAQSLGVSQSCISGSVHRHFGMYRREEVWGWKQVRRADHGGVSRGPSART